MNDVVEKRLEEALAAWTADEEESLLRARESGDERVISLSQMRLSLLSRPNGMVAATFRMSEEAYSRVREQIVIKAEGHRGAQDYDALERANIQLHFLDRARVLARKIGDADE